MKPAAVVARRAIHRKLALVVLAAGELSVRAFLDGLLLSAFGVVVVEAVTSTRVGWLFAWGFYAALVYAVAPRVFPRSIRATAGARGFRLLVALTAVGCGVALESGLWPTRPVGPSPLPAIPDAALSAYLLGMGCLLFGYLAAEQGADLLGPEGTPMAVTDELLPSVDLRADVRDHLDDHGRDGKYWAGVAASTVCFAIVYLLSCGLLGALILGVSLLYPLPELAVFLWVGATSAGDRWGGWRPNRRLPRWSVDVSERVALGTRCATRSLKGVASVLVVAFGIAPPAVMFAAGWGLVLSEVPTVQTALTYTPAEWGVALFVLVTPFLFGVYGFWYWLRVLSRLPHFLDRYEGASTAERERRRPLVARPRGYFLPPALVLLAYAVGTRWMQVTGATTVPLWLGGTWAVGAGGIAWSVWTVATGNEPQPAASENVALPLSFAVEFGGVAASTTLFAAVPRLVDGGATRGLDGGAMTVPWLVGTATVVVFYYFPDVTDLSTRIDGLRRYLVVGYDALLGGLLVAMVALVGSTTVGLLVAVLTATALVAFRLFTLRTRRRH